VANWSVQTGESSRAENQAQVEPASEASDPTAGATEPVAVDETDLQLMIVAGDTGEPIPNATVDYRVWADDEFTGREYDSRRDGVCEISFPPGTTRVELTSRVEGYADTRLEWRPDRGETVPETYRLELERAVPIGGTVVDAEGNPVGGAKVGFNHETQPGQTPRPENHQFGWIEVTTDDHGRWRINRIGEDIIGRIYGSAKHPHHVGSDMLFVNRENKAEERLRDEEYVFHLKQAFTVKGNVNDASGMPVSDAKVLVGNVGSSRRREVNVRYDGSFIVHGCEPGEQLISAEARGYAPTTRRIEIGPEMQPVQLTLEERKILKLKVVNPDGEPVPKANIWLDTFGRLQTHFDKPAPVTIQTEFDEKTDAEGRVVWNEAPDRTLRFDIHRSGYMRLNGVEIRPDGEEHVVTLDPALVVKGTVRDASRGGLIPEFRIICGWPNRRAPDGEMQPRWSSLERFWLNFADGRFEHSFEEPLVRGTTNRGYILKFEADDYAPYISRVIAADEGEVELNVELDPAASTPITVLTPDGAPAVRADVGLVRSGNDLRFLGDRLDSSTGGAVLSTDYRGQFELSPDESITRLLIAHEAGFAWVDRETAEQQGQITLQPGGRVEGVAIDGGQPVSGVLLRLQFAGESAQQLSPDYNRFKVKTDQEGRFGFPPVPAGEYHITQMIPQPQRNGNPVWTLQPIQKITVEPGSTTTLKLDPVK
jgi:uncharacterized GH25 family protein